MPEDKELGTSLPLSLAVGIWQDTLPQSLDPSICKTGVRDTSAPSLPRLQDRTVKSTHSLLLPGQEQTVGTGDTVGAGKSSKGPLPPDTHACVQGPAGSVAV